MLVEYKGFKISVPNKYATRIILKRFKNGLYENQEFGLIKKYIRPHFTVLELGACLGVTGVLTNSLLKNKQQHLLVEANPELVDDLEKTRKMNGAGFSIENCIVSKKSQKFYIYDKVVAGSAHRRDNIETGKREVEVKCTPLHRLAGKYGMKFDAMIIDIEGGELEFFSEFQKYIRQHVKIIIVELHGHLMLNKDYNNSCMSLLKRLGFKQVDKKSSVYVFVRI